jgi:hypothetical protein
VADPYAAYAVFGTADGGGDGGDAPHLPAPAAFDAPPLSVAGVTPFVGRPLPPGYVPPLAAHRRGDGVLFEADVDAVPPCLPPEAPLSFPLIAGDVLLPCRAPARARAAAVDRPAATLALGVPRAVEAGAGSDADDGDNADAPPSPSPARTAAGWRDVDIDEPQTEAVARALVLRATTGAGPRGRKGVTVDVPLGADTPQSSAALALLVLQARGLATLDASLAPAGDAGVAVVVRVALTAAAFAADDPASPDPAPPAPSAVEKRTETALGVALQALLALGDGLRVGPDADGGLNLRSLPPAVGEDGADALGPPGDPLLPHAQSLPRLLAAASLPAAAPAAPPPPGLRTPLLPHQRAGLRWMLDRETRRDGRGHGGLALHPLWVQLVGVDGQTFYARRGGRGRLSATFWTADWLRATTAGGLIADEMGVGKR